VVAAVMKPSFRFGWIREPFVWVYIGTLWLGGLKIVAGASRPIAEVDDESIVLRPLHQVFEKRVLWSSIRGTEQLMGGDRSYADLNEIYEELEYAAEVHRRLGCPVIDVSELSIEEIAQRILRTVERRRAAAS